MIAMPLSWLRTWITASTLALRKSSLSRTFGLRLNVVHGGGGGGTGLTTFLTTTLRGLGFTTGFGMRLTAGR